MNLQNLQNNLINESNIMDDNDYNCNYNDTNNHSNVNNNVSNNDFTIYKLNMVVVGNSSKEIIKLLHDLFKLTCDMPILGVIRTNHTIIIGTNKYIFNITTFLDSCNEFLCSYDRSIFYLNNTLYLIVLDFDINNNFNDLAIKFIVDIKKNSKIICASIGLNSLNQQHFSNDLLPQYGITHYFVNQTDEMINEIINFVSKNPQIYEYVGNYVKNYVGDSNFFQMIVTLIAKLKKIKLIKSIYTQMNLPNTLTLNHQMT